MNWTVVITNIISAFFLLPLNVVALVALAFLLRKKRPRLSMALGAGSLLVLVVLSMQAGSLLLIQPLEHLSMPLKSTRNTGAQAIVVLGGGRLGSAPEYGGQDVPNAITLIRLRYAAKLHQETELPVLVTGGAPEGSSRSEASVMAKVLREDFSTPVKWLEEKSDNTAQNAQYSARILQHVGVQKIFLVTDAMHMARAQLIFARSGLEVVPAPTQFVGREPASPLDFIPGSFALSQSGFALHEWIGLVWYWLRY